MSRLVRASGGGGDSGVCSRTACAISVPALLGLYLAYLTAALFLDTWRLSHTAVVPPRGAGDEALSFEKPVEARAGRGGEFLVLNPEARLPNKGRDPESKRITGDFGAHSRYYGELQSQRQGWLIARAEELRSGTQKTNGTDGAGGLEGSKGENLSSRDPEGAATKLGVVNGELGGAGGGSGSGAAAPAGARPDGEGSTAADGEVKAETDGKEEKGDEDGKRENGTVNDKNAQRWRRRELSRPNEGGGTGGNEKLVVAVPQNRAGPDHAGTADKEEEEIEAKTGGTQRAANGEVLVVFPALAETAAPRQRSPRQRSVEESAERSGSRTDGGFARERHLSALGDGKLPTKATLEERILRLERGAELWGATYVPPIEPTRRQELVDKWSANKGPDDKRQRQEPAEEVQGRILYVVSSFDRGSRLGRMFKKKVDKLDYVLMMFDEMREACEAGFRPQIHLIAAWDPSGIVGLAADRLFCKRLNSYVPFSYEEHPHSIGNGLSMKHRVYMRSRVKDFDVVLQVEDDMILTLNHIILYQEESERLKHRRGPQGNVDELHIPGFIRIEPWTAGGGGSSGGVGEEWFEWEITLSRFHPVQLQGAGTYIGLGDSKVLKGGRNNQGLWVATRSQLEKLEKKCRYLEYHEWTPTKGAHVESFSGSLEMFSSKCGFQKVFPATHFEDFLVHHRANNKNGLRGESIPAVPISMLRVWADQFLRDESLLVQHKP